MRQRLLLLPIILGFSLIALDLAVQARQRAAFDPEAFEAAAKGYEAEILRDALGVPHIYGARDRDVAFGLAYAHMEDDRATFEEILPLYRGEAALFSGRKAIPVTHHFSEWIRTRKKKSPTRARRSKLSQTRLCIKPKRLLF